MASRRLLQNDVGQSSGGNNYDVSPNILITVLVLAIAVILSASLYLLLRRHRHNSSSNTTTTRTAMNLPHSHSLSSRHRVSPTSNDNPLLDSLPLFTFDSLKSSGDCAVCLSKFEEKDLLRLLPICCHVFHADCIDTWLNSNQSCPLCRSPVILSEPELLAKLGDDDPVSLSSGGNSRSFRVEIGNVSQRNSGEVPVPVRRSYSLGGNFDYVVDDDVVSEIHSGSLRRTTSTTTEFKVEDNYYNSQQQGELAAEVGTRGGGGGWLKDYLSHSLSSSFRGSGRWFFTGSSRRETGEFGEDNRVSEMDLESSRLGDEIGELFRWLSGV